MELQIPETVTGAFPLGPEAMELARDLPAQLAAQQRELEHQNSQSRTAGSCHQRKSEGRQEGE
jgi:hypothetical protein